MSKASDAWYTFIGAMYLLALFPYLIVLGIILQWRERNDDKKNG